MYLVKQELLTGGGKIVGIYPRKRTAIADARRYSKDSLTRTVEVVELDDSVNLLDLGSTYKIKDLVWWS